MHHRVTSNHLHWALLPFVAGILIGLSVSSIILVQPYTEHVVNNIHIDFLDTGTGGEHQGELKERLARFEELMEELYPAGRFGQGPKTLAEEVTVKELMHYSIIMTEGHSLETLRDTWAGDVPEARMSYYIPFKMKEEEKNLVKKVHYNVIELVKEELNEVQVLRHICEHELNATKWFFIGYDTAYVKTHELETYLLSLEAFQDRLPYLGKPVKRDNVGRVCMPGPGSILSHSTLVELCPKLPKCTKLKGYTQTDCALGECVHSQLPNIQCSKEGHPQNLFLKFDSAKKGSIIESKNHGALKQALTIYPVIDSKLMYNIHQQVVTWRLNESRYLVQELKQMVDRMASLLPQSFPKYSRSNSDVVKTRQDITSWQLINHNVLMSKDNDNPAMKVPPFWKTQLEVLTKRSIDYLKFSAFQDDNQLAFNPIVNAYWKHNPLSGIEYIIDIETKSMSSNKEKESNSPISQYRVSLSQPFNAPEVGPILSQFMESKQVTIALVITDDQEKAFKKFMKGLEGVLKQDQHLDLVVVKMRSKNDHSQQKPKRAGSSLDSILRPYETQYLRTSFRVIDSNYLLSRSHGLALVLKELRPTDILFHADLYLKFNASFLERCRNLPLQGQQVYYPIPFTVSDPAAIYKGNKSNPISLSSHWGHWLVKSSSMSCIYAADVLSTIQKPESKGIPKEVDSKELYKNLIEKGYEVIRSPDSGVWKWQPEKSDCELDFVGEKVEPCTHKETYNKLRIRTELSELLFDHEGKQHKKF